MVAVELEVMAKKFDRFGWDRDTANDCPVQARMVTDWMDALQDFPLSEVQAACRAAVQSNPNKMPNEGHIKAQIIKARGEWLLKQPKPVEPVIAEDRCDPNVADDICKAAGFTPKRFGCAV